MPIDLRIERSPYALAGLLVLAAACEPRERCNSSIDVPFDDAEQVGVSGLEILEDLDASQAFGVTWNTGEETLLYVEYRSPSPVVQVAADGGEVCVPSQLRFAAVAVVTSEDGMMMDDEFEVSILASTEAGRIDSVQWAARRPSSTAEMNGKIEDVFGVGAVGLTGHLQRGGAEGEFHSIGFSFVLGEPGASESVELGAGTQMRSG